MSGLLIGVLVEAAGWLIGGLIAGLAEACFAAKKSRPLMLAATLGLLGFVVLFGALVGCVGVEVMKGVRA